jgi:hypothetical protein
MKLLNKQSCLQNLFPCGFYRVSVYQSHFSDNYFNITNLIYLYQQHHKRPASLSQRSAQKRNISLTGHFLHMAVTLLFSTEQLESPTVTVANIVSAKRKQLKLKRFIYAAHFFRCCKKISAKL